MLKTHGSRESSPSARKKEKPRKLFHESATKSAAVSSQSDPGMVPLSYIEYDFLLVRVSASRGGGHIFLYSCSQTENDRFQKKNRNELQNLFQFVVGLSMPSTKQG